MVTFVIVEKSWKIWRYKQEDTQMIDIHTHLLYDVDDGAESLQESLDMLKYAKEQGVDAIILTPHYRHGMFPYQKETCE